MSKKTNTPLENEHSDTLELLDDRNSESSAEESQPPPVVKPKRQLTDKQKEALAAGRQKGREKLDAMHAAIQEKRKAREEELERIRLESEQRLNQKVVKKAVQIKKKELIQQINIDRLNEEEESDDDIPVEVVRKIIAKQKRNGDARASSITRETNPVSESSLRKLRSGELRATSAPPQPQLQQQQQQPYGYIKPKVVQRPTFNFI